MELHKLSGGEGTGPIASTTPSPRRSYNEVATSSDQLLEDDQTQVIKGGSTPAALPNYDASTVEPVAEAELLSVDDAIDALGTGPFQRRILCAAGLCFAADSMEIMMLSFLSNILRDEWGLTATQTATITSCVFMGSLFGTLVLGPLGDKVGRRPVFLSCGVIITVFGVATSMANGYISLIATRFLVGFGVGGLTVPFDILAEFLPTKSRGKYLLLIEYFWTFGSMLVPLLAYVTFGIDSSWRLFVLLCAFPCLASLILGALTVPESPRWLVAEGRKAEALEILRGAATVNEIDPNILFPHGTELEDDDEEENSRFSDLLTPKWRRLTLLLWGVWFGFAWGYYGTIIAITRVFESEDDSRMGDDDATSEAVFDYSAIFISSCAELIGTALVINTVDRAGRIPTQIVAYSSGGVCLFLLCSLSGSGSRAFLVAVAFGARVCEMMGSCVTWVTTAEVLSTEIRTTGHSAANAIARIGAFSSPYIVGGKLPLSTVGFIMLAIHAFAAFCASRLPETKGVRLGHALSSAADDGRPLYQTELPIGTKIDRKVIIHTSFPASSNVEGHLHDF